MRFHQGLFLFTRPSCRPQPSLEIGLVLFLGIELFEIAQYSPYTSLTCTTQNDRRLAGLILLNKSHQAMESPSHVHRSSVD